MKKTELINNFLFFVSDMDTLVKQYNLESLGKKNGKLFIKNKQLLFSDYKNIEKFIENKLYNKNKKSRYKKKDRNRSFIQLYLYKIIYKKFWKISITKKYVILRKIKKFLENYEIDFIHIYDVYDFLIYYYYNKKNNNELVFENKIFDLLRKFFDNNNFELLFINTKINNRKNNIYKAVDDVKQLLKNFHKYFFVKLRKYLKDNNIFLITWLKDKIDIYYIFLNDLVNFINNVDTTNWKTTKKK